MYCQKCGRKLNDDMLFCDKCGTPTINSVLFEDIDDKSYRNGLLCGDDISIANKQSPNNRKYHETGERVKKERNNKKTLVLIFTLLFLVFISVFSYYLIKNSELNGEIHKVKSNSGETIEVYVADEEHIVEFETGNSGYVSNEVLIYALPNVRTKEIKNAIAPYGGRIVGRNDYLKSYQILLEDDYSYDQINSLTEEIARKQCIKSASANMWIKSSPAYIPCDELWENEWEDKPDGKNWGMEAINAPAMWDIPGVLNAAPVNVGIFDTQFYTDHEDIDFKEVYYNKFNPNVYAYTHGTHVAGTIAARFNNLGVVGVAPSVNLYGVSQYGLDTRSIKESSAGLTIQDIEAGLTYLICMKECKIINLSYTFGEDHELPYADQLSDCLSEFLDMGYEFLIVKAAGNDCIDAYNDMFPQMKSSRVQSRVITVGAARLTDDDEIAVSSFSNWGNCVDLIAPGEFIYSTVYAVNEKTGEPMSDYHWNEGTSMAAPHVTGVAAVMLSLNPNLKGNEIKQIICDTAQGNYGYEDIADYYEENPNYELAMDYRYSMLNAYAAVKRVSDEIGNTTIYGDSTNKKEKNENYYNSYDESNNNTNDKDDDATLQYYSGISGDLGFDIVGKWKNVGNTTFGQAQAGAIILFDEEKCNYVSPGDTYAFYKDGDFWRLDCTTMLFAETLSFDVVVIDNDNIIVDYGDTNVHLARIK